MQNQVSKCNILMADDDEDDCFLMKQAFQSTGFACALHSVENGKELIDYLLGHSKYHDRESFPMPDLILLDLNMPIKDGFEALKEIRSNGGLKNIPIVIVSTTSDDRTISRGYHLGANAFFCKPDDSTELLNIVQWLKKFWVGIARLPPKVSI